MSYCVPYNNSSNNIKVDTEVGQIDTDKLKTAPADLAKLSNVVKNDVVRLIIIQD